MSSNYFMKLGKLILSFMWKKTHLRVAKTTLPEALEDIRTHRGAAEVREVWHWGWDGLVTGGVGRKVRN